MPEIQHGGYLDLTILDDGKLKFSLTPEGKEEILDTPEDERDIYDRLFYNLMEDFCGNGWEFVDPEEIGALTDALILTDDCERDEEWNLIQIGRVWAYGMYAIHGYITPLLEDGEMVWEVYE